MHLTGSRRLVAFVNLCCKLPLTAHKPPSSCTDAPEMQQRAVSAHGPGAVQILYCSQRAGVIAVLCSLYTGFWGLM